MLRLSFKNVGQGDSIILEWERRGEPQIGIIDCHRLSLPPHLPIGSAGESRELYSKNPVIRRLSEKRDHLNNIAFLALSHPHFDHFSGMHDLLLYADQENLPIENFFQSTYLTKEGAQMLGNAYVDLQKYALDARGRTMLFRLLKEVKRQREAGQIINNIFVTNRYVRYPLNDHMSITFLAPHDEEFRTYMGKAKVFEKGEEEKGNNAHANYLSLVTIVEGRDWYILLTSDAESETFEKILRKRLLPEKILLLAQFPHHGSKNNHSPQFWNSLLTQTIQPLPLVFSVGDNNYGHPASEVIQFFQGKANIYATNPIQAAPRIGEPNQIASGDCSSEIHSDGTLQPN